MQRNTNKKVLLPLREVDFGKGMTAIARLREVYFGKGMPAIAPCLRQTGFA